jgi:hypothetical protein
MVFTVFVVLLEHRVLLALGAKPFYGHFHGTRRIQGPTGGCGFDNGGSVATALAAQVGLQTVTDLITEVTTLNQHQQWRKATGVEELQVELLCLSRP